MGKFQDLTGKTFGDWTVIKLSEKRTGGRVHWDCECGACGKIVGVSAHNLTMGTSNNCGCVSKKAASDRYCIDETGNVYGELTVIRRAGVDKELRATWSVRCSCGKEFVIKGKELRGGRNRRACPECSHKRGGSKIRIDISEKRYGILTAIKNVDENDYGKWLFKCDCGGEIVCNKGSVIRGLTTSCGCRNLGETPEDLTGKIYGNWLFLKISNRKRGESLRWDCQCLLCGTIRSVIHGNIKNGSSFSCGCVKSKAEFTMSKVLQENNIKFDSQKKFDGCAYKSSLFFDFYIPELNLCIETDGKQHYFPIKRFGGEEGFKYRKICDNIKNTYCAEHSINLLRIPYTQFNHIEEILRENKII